jgi:MFS family permease
MATAMSARLMLDIGTQIFNPFLPIIAAGLNTGVVEAGRLVSLRSAMGIAAPLFGALADRVGYRIVMQSGLIMTGAGLLWVGLSQSALMAAPGMILAGLGMACFLPNLQAYLSARLPYTRRARGLGMLEYTWAFTGIVGLSLTGLLISAADWRAPFYILASGMFVMAFVFRTLPPARTGPIPLGPDAGDASRVAAPTPGAIRRFFDLGPHARSAYTAIGVSALNFFGAMQLMLIHGAWLNAEYGLGPTELGTVAIVLGVFDLMASVSVSLFTDRFGKRRSVIVGSAGALVGYLALPWFNVGIIPAVLVLAFSRGFFEFAIVANFPLLSEQAPDRRGKVMTLNAAAGLSAGTIAGLTTPVLFLHYGINGVAAVSTVCTTIGLLLLIMGVREAPIRQEEEM